VQATSVRLCTSQDELLAVAREYRRRQIPLDAIVQDWQYWSGKLWGQKSFDPERYPDPTAMVQQLHEMHARLMVSICPNMTNDGPDHRQMQQQGCLLGDRSMYDAFSAKGRDLYWKQANEGCSRTGSTPGGVTAPSRSSPTGGVR
jgi:alpha-D-xyloside xylohydrolase